jgi:hypothetical protein
MESLLICYLVDGQGMELLLRRLRPSRPGQAWGALAERPGAGAAPVELCLFGLPAQHPAFRQSGPGLRLVQVPGPLKDFASWLKRDARRRGEACRYCLVSADPELRRQARELGMAELDPDLLPRRLGLVDATAGHGVIKAPPRTFREPRVVKGGKEMGPEELAWWARQLELPSDEAEDGLDTAAAASREDAGSPGAPSDEEHERFARLMGARPGDPRILDHVDEDWLNRQFPDAGAAPAGRRKGRTTGAKDQGPS